MQPPEAIGCFNNITPKSCLMEDLDKYKEVLSQLWSRGRGGRNPLEGIGWFIS